MWDQCSVALSERLDQATATRPELAARIAAARELLSCHLADRAAGDARALAVVVGNRQTLVQSARDPLGFGGFLLPVQPLHLFCILQELQDCATMELVKRAPPAVLEAPRGLGKRPVEGLTP